MQRGNRRLHILSVENDLSPFRVDDLVIFALREWGDEKAYRVSIRSADTKPCLFLALRPALLNVSRNFPFYDFAILVDILPSFCYASTRSRRDALRTSSGVLGMIRGVESPIVPRLALFVEDEPFCFQPVSRQTIQVRA